MSINDEIKVQRRFGIETEGGYCCIRVNHGRKKGHEPRVILRCGCCRGDSVEISYNDNSKLRIGLEINEVQGSIGNWREILLPLLDLPQNGRGFVVIFEDTYGTFGPYKSKEDIEDHLKFMGCKNVSDDRWNYPGTDRYVKIKEVEGQDYYSEKRAWR